MVKMRREIQKEVSMRLRVVIVVTVNRALTHTCVCVCVCVCARRTTGWRWREQNVKKLSQKSKKKNNTCWIGDPNPKNPFLILTESLKHCSHIVLHGRVHIYLSHGSGRLVVTRLYPVHI